MREFGNVHNYHTSKYKNPGMDLERTAENPKIDLADDFEMLGQTEEGPLRVETPSYIDYDNIIKMLRESTKNVTKGEETISFRLNQVYFTRKLIDGILKEWMNLEKLVEISRKDLIELVEALLKIEVLSLINMNKGFEKKEELPKQFYLSKSCINCYGPLIERNLEVSLKKYEVFKSECGNFEIDPFFNEINRNQEDFHFCEMKIEGFFEKYAKKWFIVAQDFKNARELMVLKMLAIGSNRGTMEKHFGGKGEEGFYRLDEEILNPNTSNLIDFLGKLIN